MKLNKLASNPVVVKVSTALILMTSFVANATTEGGGRDLEDGVNAFKSLFIAIGGAGYAFAMVAAIILFAIGGVIWGISSQKQGDQTKTKGTAAGFMIAAIILGSITGILSMGSNTVTNQNSEVEAFLSEE
ncbi:hypothetical protein [Vibrio harveyi]|uniref:hypothetical protein n=1 Tax=Vibrio harveyi TaxID=669 RepID=UPI00247FB090|nr:hypothetical protein [Vibrio harveyi]